MVTTKTKVIGTATTLTLTSVLVWIALNQNFILTASGDITCSGTPVYSDLYKSQISDCQIFWNITSTNYTYYFRNKEGNKLEFSPESKGYEWFVKDGRYKSGYRPMDKSGNFTFTKGKKYEFMAFVFKDPTETIKWSITSADQFKDPILYGLNVSNLCGYKTETISTYNTVTYEFTCPAGKNISVNTNKKYAECINRVWRPSNNSWDYSLNFSHTYNLIYAGNRTIYWNEYVFSHYDLKNDTCRKEGWIVEDKIINFTKCDINCNREDSTVQCDFCNGDSNCDGIINEGESGLPPCDIAESGWRDCIRKWKVDNGKQTIKNYLRDCIETI